MTHHHPEEENIETAEHECGCENGQCESGGCDGNCGCEQEVDGTEYLVHKARMKVLLEKLAAQIEKKQAKEYEQLATLMLEVHTAQSKSKEEQRASREALEEKFNKLFS